MKMSKQVVDQFERYTGQLVCASSFIACNKSRALALNLATSPGYRSDLLSILFEIECDDTVKVIETPIQNRSSMSIFDIGTTFRSICFHRDTIVVIKMRAISGDGKRLAQEYKDNHREISVTTLLKQLAQLPSSSPTQSSRSTETYEAEELVKNGQIDLAIAAFQRLHPVSIEILLRRGQLYANQKGDYDNGLQYYSQVLKLQEKVNNL